MNQVQLRTMTADRIADAIALMAGNRWSFAYYVLGYAVECALKSCILARLPLTGGIFQDKKFAEKCWTHDFNDLIKLSELGPELISQSGINTPFAKNWNVVRQWNETSRYESKSQAEAQDLYNSIADNPNGVLLWIQKFW